MEDTRAEPHPAGAAAVTATKKEVPPWRLRRPEYALMVIKVLPWTKDSKHRGSEFHYDNQIYVYNGFEWKDADKAYDETSAAGFMVTMMTRDKRGLYHIKINRLFYKHMNREVYAEFGCSPGFAYDVMEITD